MDTERTFTTRELTAAVVFAGLAIAIGTGAFRAGQTIAGGSRGGASMGAATAKPVVNGAALYAGTCAGCHGATAAGNIGPALNDAAGWTDAVFATAVLQGRDDQGKELSPVMPRFGQVGLDGEKPTAEQVRAIHAYVQNLK